MGKAQRCSRFIIIMSLLTMMLPATRATSAPNRPLLDIIYSRRALEAVEVVISNEKTNSNGSTTGNIKVQNHTSVTYLVRLIVEEGVVSGTGFDRIKLMTDKYMGFPLLGGRSFSLESTTWSSGARLRFELDRIGDSATEGLIIAAYDLITIGSLLSLGEYTPTTDAELQEALLQFLPEILEKINANATLGAEAALFYGATLRGDWEDAFNILGSIMEKTPEIWSALFEVTLGLRLTPGEVKVLGGKVKLLFKIINRLQALKVLLDRVVKPWKENVTISAPSNQNGSSFSDIVLVIDRSGSMVGQNMTAAKLSARLFIDLLRDGDRVSIVSFSSKAQLILPIVTINSQTRANARFAIDQIAPEGSTSIGAGLQLGHRQILNQSVSGVNRAIVVLSDGDENVSPYVATVLPEVARSKTPVFTIGLGSNIVENTLRHLADETNGDYYFAPTASTLATIYSRISGQLTGRQAVMSSTATVQPGRTNTHNVFVDGREATFSSMWNNLEANLDLTLKSPNGTVISPPNTTNNQAVQYVSKPGYKFYVVDNPEPGLWQMNISNNSSAASLSQENSEEYTFAAFVASDVKMLVQLTPSTTKPGQPLGISAVIHSNTGIHKDVNISVTDSRGTSMQLIDDGKNGDGINNDGTYGATVIAPITPGTYTYIIHAIHSTFTRQETVSVTVNNNVQPINDLAVIFSGPERAPINTPTSFQAFVINNGPSGVSSARIYLTLDTNISFVSSSLGNPVQEGGRLIWAINNISANSSMLFTITLAANSTSAYGKEVASELRVEANNIVSDNNRLNNTSSTFSIIGPNTSHLPLLAKVPVSLQSTAQPTRIPTITPSQTTKPTLMPTNTRIPSPSPTTVQSTPTYTPTPTRIPTITPTPISAPNAVIEFTTANITTAGSNREVRIRLIANEPTRWNANAFTSNCGLTGLASGFATTPLTAHIVSTIVHIPDSAGRRLCTIEGMVTTYGLQYPSTTLPVKLQFEVYGLESVVVPEPLWSNLSSIEVIGGCVSLVAYVNGSDQTMQTCESISAVSEEWNDTVNTITALCAPSTAPITIRVWEHIDYYGEVWPYTLCKANNNISIQYMEVRISADNLDGFEDSDFRISGDSLANNWVGADSFVMTGMIFQNISIPKDATIVNAQLRMRGFGNDGVASTKIQGFAQDNTPPFNVDGANKPSTRPISKASVDWTKNWQFRWQWISTPNIAPIIQETVARNGWFSGSSLGFRFSNPSGTGVNWSSVDYAGGAYEVYSGGSGHQTSLFIAYSIP